MVRPLVVRLLVVRPLVVRPLVVRIKKMRRENNKIMEEGIKKMMRKRSVKKKRWIAFVGLLNGFL